MEDDGSTTAIPHYEFTTEEDFKREDIRSIFFTIVNAKYFTGMHTERILENLPVYWDAAVKTYEFANLQRNK